MQKFRTVTWFSELCRTATEFSEWVEFAEFDLPIGTNVSTVWSFARLILYISTVPCSYRSYIVWSFDRLSSWFSIRRYITGTLTQAIIRTGYITVKSIIRTRVLAIFPWGGIRKTNTFQLYAVGTFCVHSHANWYKTVCFDLVQVKSITNSNTSCGTMRDGTVAWIGITKFVYSRKHVRK